MGKNKKKNNSVFKVAGAKSLKMKAKAKVVKSQLKNIKLKTKEKVSEVDKALEGLQEKVRTSATEVKETSGKKLSALPTSDVDLNVKKASEEAVNILETMQI